VLSPSVGWIGGGVLWSPTERRYRGILPPEPQSPTVTSRTASYRYHYTAHSDAVFPVDIRKGSGGTIRRRWTDDDIVR